MEENQECSHCDPKRDQSFFPFCKLKPVHPHIEPAPEGTRLKLHHTLLPDEKYTIQRNFVGNRTPRTHTVVWSCDDNNPQPDELADIGRGKETGTGEFVRSLKVGDVVNVWAKARFPAWVNYVDEVEVVIYWAV
jgi:hypothetical protein